MAAHIAAIKDMLIIPELVMPCFVLMIKVLSYQLRILFEFLVPVMMMCVLLLVLVCKLVEPFFSRFVNLNPKVFFCSFTLSVVLKDMMYSEIRG